MSDSNAPMRPVFYDESRRRWSWVSRLGIAAFVVSSLAIVCFLVSILALPLLPHNVLPKSMVTKDVGNPNPIMTDHRQAKRQFAQKSELRRLAALAAAEAPRKGPGRDPAGLYHLTGGPNKPVVAGFYVNWEETSRASLKRHIDELTHFFPEWLHITSDGKSVKDGRNSEDRVDIDPLVRKHGIPILPVVNNYLPRPGQEDGDWNAEAVHKIISNPANRAAFIHNLKISILDNKWQGVNIDFEIVPAQDRDNLTAFMHELYVSFHKANLLVTQDIQLEDDAFDIERLALWNDAVMPMMYDQHSPNTEEGAGSIAGISWTQQQLAKVFKNVPAGKVVLCLGNYAYDWKKGDTAAVTMTYQGAVIQAKESTDPKDPNIAKIQIDPKSLNPFYSYFDDSDKEHTVWMMDATTVWNQWSVAKPYAPAGYALWYLGAEDPGLWSVMGRNHIAQNNAATVDKGILNTITYGRQAQVDFEGEGELLEVLAEPSDGHRTLVRDPKTNLITGESYTDYPSSYVVRRYGNRPKSIVLTFDDGPDPTWTPQILDILKREGVKGTFFVIGQQAQSNPSLIGRMWDEGNEIGNHTFTHPNLSEVGRERTLLEITTTQRVIEAITGHSSSLFRPPYAIDVEPRTGGELKPIILASKWNFISVGEKNDPQDWNLFKKGPNGEQVARTADDIAESVWDNRNEGSIVLLHDGGGDRSATVKALPAIIHRLKAAGYTFISVSDLLPGHNGAGARAALFPAVTGRDEVLVGIDKYVFEVSYLLQRLLVTLFTLSVILGISRQIWMAVMALIQRRRELAREAVLMGMPAPHVSVSVIIAAYNEEMVIERTVRTVLDSNYPDLEVIVVDDGSSDRTFAVCSVSFASDPRVICIRKENGGKSSALNRGLLIAKGEVIVALDADTLFAPDTIARLVRHFEDPKVGAVSGNVRVGNTNNILTRWQALEYITSQNFDRRAYDLLNCITVVPGAVGAWRRIAIQEVGGYTHETLAEDTDLTWKIRRAGWRILNDSTALAFTEAPESLGNLSRQRFRWAFGTLQNLWKHRDATLRNGAFGWVALPSLWLYQIVFPAISPIMDLTVIWALFAGSLGHVLGYYGLMVGVEFVGAAIALKMDKGNWRLLPWLFLQRFVYRQMMYYVILKSVVAAVRGGAVGWNKFERTGTVQMEQGVAVVEERKPTPIA
jgi:cellulose synthase/poly-beta-1,6-N-acetylglucosamine synthase-like glycosyltransferase/peptidoglycan/xylan/chitin deacetylase (PgdA/CDA1 family)/spore germination protein YaaH